jgi:hypothetical protein
MSKSALKRACVAYLQRLKEAGEKIFYLRVCGDQMDAQPDLMILHRGVIYAVKLKMPGKRLTKFQRWTLDEMSVAGCKAVVVSSVLDLWELLGSPRARHLARAGGE